MIHTIKLHIQVKTSTKIILTLIVVFCTIGLPIVTLSAYQYNRYQKGVFDCDDMSKELEPILEKLGFDTLAFDFFDGITLPKEPDSVPARAWLAGEISNESEIVEQSFSLGNYGFVLSLLWICGDIKTTYRRYGEESEGPEFDLTNPFTPDGKRWKW